jgi:hypothetical protein
MARDFTKRFYELSCGASGQYATAFATACTELSGALKEEEARPCLLQTGSGQEGRKIWDSDGKKLVTIADEHLHLLVPVEPTPTVTLKKKPKKKSNNVTLGSVGEEEAAAAEEEEEEEEEEDILGFRQVEWGVIRSTEPKHAQGGQPCIQPSSRSWAADILTVPPPYLEHHRKSSSESVDSTVHPASSPLTTPVPCAGGGRAASAQSMPKTTPTTSFHRLCNTPRGSVKVVAAEELSVGRVDDRSLGRRIIANSTVFC